MSSRFTRTEFTAVLLAMATALLMRTDTAAVESSSGTAEQVRERARACHAEILGIGIGPEALLPWCSEHHLVRSLSYLGPDVVDGSSRL